MTDKQLKPCPFCGSEVIQIVGFGGLRFFKCRDTAVCGAVTSFDSDAKNQNPQLAVDAWNSRVQSEL